jgi:hypothetical protein
MKPVKLRPHHGICFQFFAGKGYSDDFVENMDALYRKLEENTDTKIQLQSETDLLCEHCPHNCGGVCETAEKAAKYDRACLEFCGLKNGALLSWEEFRGLVRQRILAAGRREEICGDCGWSGICQQQTVENNV